MYSRMCTLLVLNKINSIQYTVYFISVDVSKGQCANKNAHIIMSPIIRSPDEVAKYSIVLWMHVLTPVSV